MPRISITEKLTSYFVLIGVGCICLIGSASYHYSKKAILQRTYDQLISVRMEKKTRLEQFFKDRIHDLQVVSGSKEVKEIIESPHGKQQLTIDNQNYFKQFVLPVGYFNQIYIYHTDPSLSQTPLLQLCDSLPDIPKETLDSLGRELQQKKHFIIHDISVTNKNIVMAAAVSGLRSAYPSLVMMSVSIEAINKIMFEHQINNGLGNTGETYLVSHDSLMRSNSRFSGNAVLHIQVTSAAVTKAFEGSEGCEIVRDYRGVSCLSSYSPVDIPGLNWVILAEIDEDEAMNLVYSLRNTILLISVFVAALVFTGGFLLSMKISSPLRRLQQASEKIGDGNYNIHLRISSQDEIGDLTETFNIMSERLKAQAEEILLEKNKRYTAWFDGQEMERQRLAKDLHDGLGQSILSAHVKMEHLKIVKPEESPALILETQQLLKGIISDIRNISADLMPPVLLNFGILTAVKNLLDETSRHTGILFDFHHEVVLDKISEKQSIYIYRIIQEALSNIVKHAETQRVSIHFTTVSEEMRLEIQDHGVGFDMEKSIHSGNGIFNMKERVRIMEGSFSIESSQELGTRLIISLPLQNEGKN